MKIVRHVELPWNLLDVVSRINEGAPVHGFELELLASYVS